MNFLQAFKELVTRDVPGTDDFELYALTEIHNWPDVETDGETERLDLENVELLELTDDKAVVWGGGDWQEPMKVTVELVEGKLSVTDFEHSDLDSPGAAMEWDEILEILDQAPK
jgi:hypothetical protein